MLRAFARVRMLIKAGGWCPSEFDDRASIMARGPRERVFSLRALRRLLADDGFTLRASGHPGKCLRADHSVSLLRYKAGWPTVRTALGRLAAANSSGCGAALSGLRCDLSDVREKSDAQRQRDAESRAIRARDGKFSARPILAKVKIDPIIRDWSAVRHLDNGSDRSID
jgi:hypothetical protein